jgi:hypothetical protein
MASKKTIKPAHTKKEIKRELESKIESALPEVKAKLGGKKFHRRIKKAVKILTQGFHTKDLSNISGNGIITPQTASKKLKDIKKAKAVKPLTTAD